MCMKELWHELDALEREGSEPRREPEKRPLVVREAVAAPEPDKAPPEPVPA